MRKWPFGLRRSAALLASLIAIGVAGADEAAAVKVIEKLGGGFERDDSQPGNPIVGVYLIGSVDADRALKQLKEFGNLRAIYLDESKVTDDGLKELKTLKHLQHLSLTQTNVSGAGLKDLGTL
jgi:internalin A